MLLYSKALNFSIIFGELLTPHTYIFWILGGCQCISNDSSSDQLKYVLKYCLIFVIKIKNSLFTKFDDIYFVIITLIFCCVKKDAKESPVMCFQPHWYVIFLTPFHRIFGLSIFLNSDLSSSDHLKFSESVDAPPLEPFPYPPPSYALMVARSIREKSKNLLSTQTNSINLCFHGQ